MILFQSYEQFTQTMLILDFLHPYEVNYLIQDFPFSILVSFPFRVLATTGVVYFLVQDYELEMI